MNKIDLLNVRYDPAVRPQYTVDSTEDKILPCTLLNSNLSQIPFRSADIRIADHPSGCGKNDLDYTIVDRNGEFYEFSRSFGKKNTVQYRSDLTEDVKPRPRINTPTMNRVLDSIHDYEGETVAKRLELKLVKGGVMSTLGREVDIQSATKDIGPGAYDVDRFERSKSCGLLKFSSLPREFDLGVGSIPNKRRYRSFGSESESPELLNVEQSVDGQLQDNQVRTIKFSTAPRWKHPIYKQESYVKTTGLILSPDWDKKMDKKIPFSLKNSGFRSDIFNTTSAFTGSVDITPDCGPKATLHTSMLSSPIRYAAPFKCKADVGLKTPIPESGVLIGPGSFPGAFQSSVIVKDPSKPSNSFLHSRDISFGKNAAPDLALDIKPTPPIQGGRFNKAGEQAGRNVHLRKVAMKKISQIYPRLAVKKYGQSEIHST